MILPLLLACTLAYSLRIYDNDVNLSPMNAETFRQRIISAGTKKRLWMIQSDEPPPDPHGFLGNRTYIVYSHNLSEFRGATGFAAFTSAHKYKPKSHDGNVHVRCIDCTLLAGAVVMSKHRALIKGPVSDKMMQKLANSHNVVWMDYATPLFKPATTLSRAYLTQAQATLPPFGTGQRIFISDAGLDIRHCAFNDSVAPSYATLNLTGALPPVFTSNGKVIGILTVEVDDGVYTTNPIVDGAHGTAVSGIALGSMACPDAMGIAPGAQVLFMDISDPDGSDGLVDFPHMAAFETAVNNSCYVHSASWSVTNITGYYSCLDADFDNATWQLGLLHVVTMPNQPGIASPAIGKNVISVGAGISLYPGFTIANQALYVWNGSGTGPTHDGRPAPTLIAPGYQVLAPYALVDETVGYDSFSYEVGASLATAGVAALATLVDTFIMNATGGTRASPALKKAILINCAIPTLGVVSVINDTVTVVPGRIDTSFGVPRLDLAVDFFLDSQPITTRNAFCFTSTSTFASFSMAYVDPPGVPGTWPIMVNILGLFVQTQRGYLPYWPQIANTAHRVQVGAFVGESLRVIVTANSISWPQTFALVASGVSGGQACGTCLISDPGVVQCTIDGQAQMQYCPYAQVWNGTACIAIQAGAPACSLQGGTGYSNGTACLPNACEPGYYMTVAACTCYAFSPCNMPCIDNAFAPCPVQRLDRWQPASDPVTIFIVVILMASAIGLAIFFIIGARAKLKWE
jgi:hypothetical protein